jgi:hypothetical protein
MMYNSGYNRNVLENAGMTLLQKEAADAYPYRDQSLDGKNIQPKQ